MAIPKEFLDSLLERIDLPGLIAQSVPSLKKISPGNWQACCPFHDENTPSFTVSEGKGFYHCFGCSAHGNAFNFLMEYKGVSFPQAVEEAAAFAGMQLPQQQHKERTDQEKHEAIRYMRALDTLEQAQAIYAESMYEHLNALSYLTGRGVLQSSIEKYGIGYAPDGWNTITGRKSFTKEMLEDSGLASKKAPDSTHLYDRFRDRIMFPIYNKKGRVVGFGGRSMKDGAGAKYLNSPDSIVFDKSENLYGLKQAQDAIHHFKRVFVVEGYMDVVMLAQYGIQNVVATLGTSITDIQMRKLLAMCEHVTFCMDGDEAGLKAAGRAAENALPYLDENRRVDFMLLPDGMDPDDFMRSKGKAAFEEIADNVPTLTEYILNQLVSDTEMENGESLARFLTKANALSDSINNSALRLSFQKQIADRAGISLDAMLGMLNVRSAEHVADNSREAVAQVDPRSPGVTKEISTAAKLLGVAVLKDRSAAMQLNPDYLSRFLTADDKALLLPLLAYVNANPDADDNALMATFSYSPFAKLITSMLQSSKLVDDAFDAAAAIESVIVVFRNMDRVWQTVNAAKKAAKSHAESGAATMS